MFAHDLHSEDSKRHWCPQCEKFAGGETLQIALEDRWLPKGVIFRQTFWLMRRRQTNVYHVTLQRGNRLLELKIIDNPFVSRLIGQLGRQIVQLNEQHITAQQAEPCPAPVYSRH
jgi:hypothetical protein